MPAAPFAGDVITKIDTLTAQITALIPRLLWICAVLFVGMTLMRTRSVFKTILAALGAALVLMATGNMPALSEMWKTELSSPRPPTSLPDGHPHGSTTSHLEMRSE